MSHLYQYNGKEWIEIAKNGKDVKVDYDFIVSQIPKPKDGKDGKDAVIDEKIIEPIVEKKVLDGMAIIDGRIKAIDQRWKGGGLSKVTTDATLTGTGTPANPLHVVGSSPLTTKGDLYGYSTTNARIPVGTNTQVLTADSTQALGVKWATPTVTTAVGPANAIQYTNGSGAFQGTSNATVDSSGNMGIISLNVNGTTTIGSTGNISAQTLNLNSNSVFQNDGSGNVSAGNITWDPTGNINMAPPGSPNTVPFNTSFFTDITIYNDGDVLGLIQPSQANPGVQLTSYKSSIDTSSFITANASYLSGTVRQGYNGQAYSGFSCDNSPQSAMYVYNPGNSTYGQIGVNISNVFGYDGSGFGFNSDGSGNITFDKKITALAIKKSGGTASQTLMADGSTTTTPKVVATAKLSGQTGSATILSYTTPNDGVAHIYEVGMYLDVTAITAASVIPLLNFFTETNSSVSGKPQGWASITVTGAYSCPTATIVAYPNTVIALSTLFVGTSTTYYGAAQIKLIS